MTHSMLLTAFSVTTLVVDTNNCWTLDPTLGMSTSHSAPRLAPPASCSVPAGPAPLAAVQTDPSFQLRGHQARAK